MAFDGRYMGLYGLLWSFLAVIDPNSLGLVKAYLHHVERISSNIEKIVGKIRFGGRAQNLSNDVEEQSGTFEKIWTHVADKIRLAKLVRGFPALFVPETGQKSVRLMVLPIIQRSVTELH